MDLASTVTKLPVDFASRVPLSELLTGPCLAELSFNSSTGRIELSLRLSTVDLTFKDVNGISPGLLAELFSTATPAPFSGGSSDESKREFA